MVAVKTWDVTSTISAGSLYCIDTYIDTTITNFYGFIISEDDIQTTYILKGTLSMTGTFTQYDIQLTNGNVMLDALNLGAFQFYIGAGRIVNLTNYYLGGSIYQYQSTYTYYWEGSMTYPYPDIYKTTTTV